MIKKLVPFILLVILLLPGCIGEQESSDKTGTISTQPKINATDLPTLISELKKKFNAWIKEHKSSFKYAKESGLKEIREKKKKVRY